MYIFPINSISKKNRVIRQVMRNPYKLNFRHYSVHMIKPNEHLYVLPVLNPNKPIGDTKLDEILLHGITNGWVKKDLPKFFNDVVPFKKAFNRF